METEDGIILSGKGASQRPSKVIYDRKYSAVSLSQKNEYDWINIFKNVNWFHWTGINPALSDNLADICLEACKIAKSNGITVSCDLTSEAAFGQAKRLRT